MSSIVPINEEDKNICIFCLDDIGEAEKNTNIFGCDCNVYYHDNCMTEWLLRSKLNCPMCRSSNFTIIRQQVEDERIAILNRKAILVLYSLGSALLTTIIIFLLLYIVY